MCLNFAVEGFFLFHFYISVSEFCFDFFFFFFASRDFALYKYIMIHELWTLLKHIIEKELMKASLPSSTA